MKAQAAGQALISLAFASVISLAAAQATFDYATAPAGNPVFDGFYADPEIRIYNNTFWVFPTVSIAFEDQKWFDAFSSPDLVHWTKHPEILRAGEDVSWARDNMWAPTSLEQNGKYWFYFSANGLRTLNDRAGLGVAVADSPGGPYVDALDGQRLISELENNANPMDPDIFVDDDGQTYFYYGGTAVNVALLNTTDMVSFLTPFKDVTPAPTFVEATKVFKRNGIYYMMWSENGYGDPTYQAAYATANSPLGPFTPRGVVLQQDPAVAVATGHNSVLNIPGTDVWYIVYHRRPLNEQDANSRTVALDRMYFNADGTIQPIRLLVDDNFDDNALSVHGWEYIETSGVGSGSWALEEGHLQMSGEGALNLMYTNFTDLVFSADIDISSGNATAGLVFRATTSTAYAALLDTAGNLTLVKLSGGNLTDVLANTTVGVEAGQDLRVEATGSSLAVYVGVSSTPAVEVDDSSYTFGRTGLWVQQGTATFDNVSVRKV